MLLETRRTSLRVHEIHILTNVRLFCFRKAEERAGFRRVLSSNVSQVSRQFLERAHNLMAAELNRGSEAGRDNRCTKDRDRVGSRYRRIDVGVQGDL
jgi:hypothetical protein